MIKDQIGELLTDETKINERRKGISGLPIYLIKHLGESGVDMMHEILKRVSKENRCQKSGRKVRSSPYTSKTGTL